MPEGGEFFVAQNHEGIFSDSSRKGRRNLHIALSKTVAVWKGELLEASGNFTEFVHGALSGPLLRNDGNADGGIEQKALHLILCTLRRVFPVVASAGKLWIIAVRCIDGFRMDDFFGVDEEAAESSHENIKREQENSLPAP